MDNINKLLTQEFLEEIMRQELTFAMNEAEEADIRTAATKLLAYYTVQGQVDA